MSAENAELLSVSHANGGPSPMFQDRVASATECWVLEEDLRVTTAGWLAGLRSSSLRGAAPGRVLGPGKLRASLLSCLMAANAWRFTPLIGRCPNLRGAIRRQVMTWTL